MSSSVVVAGLATVLLSMSVTVTGAASALTTGVSVTGAADAAALAAADALLGFVAGEPCDRAAEVARLNNTSISSCAVEATSVLVRVSRVSLGIRVESSARAGLSAAR